jgi:hypothetical protein
MPRGKAKRIESIDAFVSGAEPTFVADHELTKLELIVAMNWYNANRDSKDAKKYLLTFMKDVTDKKTLKGFDSLADVECRTAGILARMQERGAKLSPSDRETFECVIMGLTNAAEQTDVADVTTAVKKPNVQDFMRAKANSAIGILEEMLDNVDPDAIDKALEGINGPHQAKWILGWVEKKEAEFNEVLTTKDEQIKEGYSNYSKKEIKTTLELLSRVGATLGNRNAVAKQSRKPRAKKLKSADQVVSAVKFLKNDAELKIASVNPAEIIGAQQLWVFNTKYRKLGVFIASDPQGLTVKGTTVKNFDESKSFCKTVRKPDSKLPELVKAGKVALRTFMDDIKAKAATLKGRLNDEILLVKVVK